MSLSPAKKEKLWEAAQRLRRFTVEAIVMDTGIFPPAARLEIEALVKQGKLRTTSTIYYLPVAGRKKRGPKAPTVLPNADGIWAMIRHMKDFTLSALAAKVKMDDSEVAAQLRPLIRGGYVAKTKEGFTLAKDNGVHRPKLLANGQPRPASNIERLWAAMKVLKMFDARDLALSAQTSPREATEYCEQLALVGYLGIRAAGKQDNGTTWCFNRAQDTGPQAPVANPDGTVYDANLRKNVGGAA